MTAAAPRQPPSPLRHLAALKLAAMASPTAEAGAAWQEALQRVLADIAGGPLWVRCLPRPDSTAAVVAAARDWPELFEQPLWFARAGLRRLSWEDVVLVGRPADRPPCPLGAVIGCGVWFGEGLGLLPSGTVNLSIACDRCREAPLPPHDGPFESLNPIPGLAGERARYRQAEAA